MQSSIFASAHQRSVWARMVQQGESGSSSVGGQWWRYIKNRALANAYSDNGLWGALAWAMSEAAGSPDNDFAEASWQDLKRDFIDNAGARGNRNTQREHMWQWVMVGGALSSWMTAAQRAELVAALNDIAVRATTNTSLPADYPVNAADSDLMSGVTMGLLLMLVTMGEHETEGAVIRDIVARVKVGGFDATGPVLDANGRPDCSTFRNAVRAYCYLARPGVGAEWIESGEYNMGTLKIVAGGAAAIRNGLGRDAFPEVTALLPEILRTLVMRITPDRKSLIKWGDEQNPDDAARMLHYYLETMMLYAGLVAPTGDTIAEEAAFLVETLADETNARTGGDTDAPWARGFLHYDPETQHRPVVERRTLECVGMGLILHRYDDRLFVAQFPPSAEVQSPGLKAGMLHHAPCYHGSFQVYDQGAYAPRHPHTYGGPSLDGRSTNSCVVAGLPLVPSWRFNELRGLVAMHRFDERTVYAWGVQGGSVFTRDSYQPPPAFLHEDTRCLLELSDLRLTVVVERVHADDPTKLPDFVDYKKAQQYMTGARRAQWTYHAPNPPTLYGPEATWEDAKGQVVRLVVTDPEADIQVIDEDTLTYHAQNNPTGWQGINPTEQRWHVRVNDAGPDKAFTVHAAVIGRDFDGDRVERLDGGLLIATPMRTVAVFWNTEPGPRLQHAAYSAENAQRIVSASDRTRGFSFTLPQAAEVYLLHMGVEADWHINGSPLTSYPVVAGAGIARLDLAAGAYTVTHGAEAPTPPAPASSLKATITEGEDMQIDINLVWQDESNNEDAFDVERAIGEVEPLTWETIGSVPAGVTTYLDQNVQQGAVLNYQVRSKNAAGRAEPSNVETIHAVVLPAAATRLVVSLIARP